MAITYVGSGAEAAATGGGNPAVPYPSGIQAGDLLWLPCSASVATAFATNAVSGFTRRYALNSGGGSPVGAGFYKIATGTETGTVTLNSPGGLSIGRMFAYRGVDQTTPFDIADAAFGSSTGVTSYVIPDQTTSIAGCTLLLHTWSNATTGTWTQPGGYTELMDSTAGGTVNATSVAHLVAWGSSGATGTRTVTRSASSRGGAAGVVLRPAGATVTGAADVTLPALTAAATVDIVNPGAVALALPSLAVTATGDLTNPGTVAAALPSLSATATGVSTNPGAAAVTLPPLTAATSGAVALLADVTATLPALTATIGATSRATGVVAATLPSLSAAAVGGVKVTGSAAATLPGLTSAAVVNIANPAAVAVTLPLLQATATVAPFRIEGAAEVTLPALTAESTGVVFLDTSNWRDITVTVGHPGGHPFAVGVPTGHPMTTGTPTT